ncbi:MAG: oxidoreductase [Planctomycetaceae bacterium]|nr:oxidoreductase [Planctomycetaceae bacterium]
MINLDGHTALVTGSTMGVGRSIATTLAKAGANVIVHGLRDDQPAQETLAELKATGRDCHLITGDLSAPTMECIPSIVDQALSCRDDIDLLASNAGTYSENEFLEMEFETFDRTMKLNVYSHFFLTQAFARRWIENSVKGRVLLTGSINGRLAEQVHAAYDTSKGAVETMVKTLCVTLAPHGIRVNGMAPGLVKTPLTSPALDNADFMRWMELHTPSGEVPDASPCGAAAAFLLSDEAWHVHGQMLLVDGGMSAWQQPDPP